MPVLESLQTDLDQSYTVAEDQIQRYREEGYVHCPAVLLPGTLEHFRGIISQAVLDLSAQTKPLAERTIYEKAFLQVMNLWQHALAIRQLVFSRRLAAIASMLMGCRGVRIYRDQALYKEPGGITPFHADQYYWPWTRSKTVHRSHFRTLRTR